MSVHEVLGEFSMGKMWLFPLPISVMLKINGH